MKKQFFCVCVSMIFLFTACSGTEVSKGNEEVGAETHTYIDNELDESGSHPMEEITEIDCYVESFECGYVSYADVLGEGVLLITSEEDLAQAEEYDCLTVVDEWWANNAIAEAFGKLKENYPIEDYAYLIEYQETACGGYYFHADKVGILEDRIGFLLDEQESPGPNEAVTEVMGGFCHMAAIPKAEIEGKTFVNVR